MSQHTTPAPADLPIQPRTRDGDAPDHPPGVQILPLPVLWREHCGDPPDHPPRAFAVAPTARQRASPLRHIHPTDPLGPFDGSTRPAAAGVRIWPRCYVSVAAPFIHSGPPCAVPRCVATGSLWPASLMIHAAARAAATLAHPFLLQRHLDLPTPVCATAGTAQTRATWSNLEQQPRTRQWQ